MALKSSSGDELKPQLFQKRVYDDYVHYYLHQGKVMFSEACVSHSPPPDRDPLPSGQGLPWDRYPPRQRPPTHSTGMYSRDYVYLHWHNAKLDAIVDINAKFE